MWMPFQNLNMLVFWCHFYCSSRQFQSARDHIEHVVMSWCHKPVRFGCFMVPSMIKEVFTLKHSGLRVCVTLAEGTIMDTPGLVVRTVSLPTSAARYDVYCHPVLVSD